MKRFFTSMAVCTIVASAFACTNFIVGKKASTDGSVICSYNADSYGAYMPLYHYPAAKHQKGDKRKVYEWDTNKYLGEIDEALETYNVVGNINEWQVTIGETTYGGREEMADSTGIIDYGSLIYIALQRSKSAREAIQVMTSLVEQYGYCSEGETFTICDPNEAWIMEMRSRPQCVEGTHGMGSHASARRLYLCTRQPKSHRKVRHEGQAECSLFKECHQVCPQEGLVYGT